MDKHRDMIRDMIRMERDTPIYNKRIMPELFSEIMIELWPLRESVARTKTDIVLDSTAIDRLSLSDSMTQ